MLFIEGAGAELLGSAGISVLSVLPASEGLLLSLLHPTIKIKNRIKNK
jgi:hypothetical protein